MNSIRDELNEIIEKLCTSGSKILDDKLMKQLKIICRQNDDHVNICFNLLINEFKKQHCEIRYSAFQISDYLFDRSFRFRDLILNDFQTFLEYIFDLNPEKPLPAPKQTANELKKLAAVTVKKWNEKFGSSYKILNLGFNYLKNCKKIDFIEFNHQSVAERRNFQENLKKKEIQLNTLVCKSIQEMNEKEIDIRSSLQQLERCLNILIPKPNEIFNEMDFESVQPTTSNLSKIENKNVNNNDLDDDSDDDDDMIEVVLPGYEKIDTDEELRYLGFLNGRDSEYTRGFEINVNLSLDQNEDNRILIENIKDLYKELKYTHFEAINSWIKNFSAVKNATDKLKRAIDLKNDLQNIFKNIEVLGIKLDDLKRNNNKNDVNINKKNVKLPLPPINSNKKRPIDDNFDTNDRKKKLLKKAPVINLHEIELGVSISSKVECNNPFVQSTEVDRSNEIKPTLAKKVFIGTYEPVKWKCRAPLHNGKLCERMDRYKCPFHGKIIGRDSKTGKATNINEETIKSLKSNEQPYNPLGDKDFLADIEGQTGRDLGSSVKKKTKNKKGNLTDLNKDDNTSYKRLESKLFNPKSLLKVGKTLDNIEKRQNFEKYHHNFSYSITQ